jgi:hypothetical protein
MPAMGRAPGADAGTVELTISCYPIGFNLGRLLRWPIGSLSKRETTSLNTERARVSGFRAAGMRPIGPTSLARR